MKTKTSLAGRSAQELQELLAPLDFKIFQVNQLMAWIYRKGASDFSGMTDLSQDLRAKLENDFSLHELTVARKSPAIRVSRVKDVNFFIAAFFFECNWGILEIDNALIILGACGRL